MKTLILLSLFCFSALGTERVTVKNAKTLDVLQIADFEKVEVRQEWVDMLAKTSAWGKAAHKKCEERMPREVEPLCEDVPSEYVVEVVNIDAEIAERESRKLAKVERKKKLKEIDWSKVTTVASIRDLLKTVIQEMED